MFIHTVTGMAVLAWAIAFSQYPSLGRDLRVTIVPSLSTEEWRRHPNSVLVYETSSGSVRLEDYDYWPVVRKVFCGDDPQTPGSHRFRDTEVDLTKCPELYDVVKKHDGGPVQDLRHWRNTCDQQHGLLALTMSVWKVVPGLLDTLDDLVLEGEMTTSVCDAYAIYVDSLDTLLFVDSVDIDNFATETEWGFGFGYFDAQGQNFYYGKRYQALRYNLASARIDTIYGFSDPIIPSNRMAVLAYSKDRKEVALLDNSFDMQATIGGDLGKVWSVYAMSDSVFLIGAEVQGRSRPRVACWLYDFAGGTRRKLFTSRKGEILSAEWAK